MKNSYTHVEHTFEPVYDIASRILILGSLPSVSSREQGFYYGHPRNRFWQVTAAVCGEEVPETILDKKQMLLRNGIALWDVISECDIIGSSDQSVKNVLPADIGSILTGPGIKEVFGNGGLAVRLYRRYQQPLTGAEIIPLPSTSPANAAYSLERLIREWKGKIEPFLNKINND